MRKAIYFIILTTSLSLAFTQGKACCKNKSKKNKVACNINKATIDINNDGSISKEEIKINDASDLGSPIESNCSSKKVNSCCNDSTKKPWWKFWKNKKNCCNSKV